LDEVVIFKALVLQALYNLSDDQAEYQLRDRFSFMRFLGLELEDAIPDARLCGSIARRWPRRRVEELFDLFDGFLKTRAISPGRADHRRDDRVGTQATQFARGQRDDQGRRNAGGLEIQAAKNRQKDKDARWTKKHERSYFGYKNHIGVDRRHKFVRRYVVSDASVHDSQKFEDVLDTSNTASDVWPTEPIAAMRSRKSWLSAA